MFRPNRLIFLTPEEQARKDAANQRRIDAETERIKNLPVGAAKETITPPASVGVAKGVITPTIFQGGSTDKTITPPVIKAPTTPVVEPVQTVSGITPKSYEKWKSEGGQAAGGYQGYLNSLSATGTPSHSTTQYETFSDGQMTNSEILDRYRGTNEILDPLRSSKFSTEEQSYIMNIASDIEIKDGQIWVTLPDGTGILMGNMLQDEMSAEEGFNAVAKKYGREDLVIPETTEDKLAEYEAKALELMDQENEKSSLMASIDEAKLKELGQQAEGNISALKATFGEGREGVTTSVRPGLIASGTATINARMDTAKASFRIAAIQRHQAQQKLEEAIKDGAKGIIADAQEALIRAETGLQKARTAADEAANQTAKETRETIKAASEELNSFIDNFSMDELAELDPATIMSFSDSISNKFGLDDITSGEVFKSFAAKQAMAKAISTQKDPSKAAEMLKQFKKLGIDPTPGMKNIAALQMLRDAGVDEATIEDFRVQAGFVQDPKNKFSVFGNEKTGFAVLDQTTGNTNAVAMPKGKTYESEYVQSYSNTTSGSVSIGVVVGDFGGECGEFANKLLGEKKFGDTLASKMSVQNSNIAAPGSYVVMDTATQWGHVAYVESVNYDENGDPFSMNLLDSNWKVRTNPKTVDRRTVTIPGNMMITGFYNPALDSSYAPEAVAEAQANGGLTPERNALLNALTIEYDNVQGVTAKNEVFQKIMDAGLMNQFDARVNPEFTAAQNNMFVSIRKDLPTRIVDSDKDGEILKKFISDNPNVSPTELKRMYIVGPDYTTIEKGGKNVLDRIIDISGGQNSADPNLPGTIQRAVNGDYLGAINTTESAKLRQAVDKDYSPDRVETNLRMVGKALDLIAIHGENVGKVQGNFFRLSAGLGLNTQDTVEIESLLTWMIAPVRNQIAGTAVTENEEIFLEPIIPQITDPEENLKAKLNTIQFAYLTGYNSSRTVNGLVKLEMKDIMDPLGKVRLYESGMTPQSQAEKQVKDIISKY